VKYIQKVTMILIAGLLLTLIIVPLQSGIAAESIRIFIDNQEIAAEVQPVIVNDRTMVPLRVISENLGMTVDWDGDTRSVFITFPGKFIPGEYIDHSIPDGESISIFIDGVYIKSELKPFIKNDRTMVPLRVISEGLGMEVDWKEAERMVLVNRPLPVSQIPEQPSRAKDNEIPASNPVNNEVTETPTPISAGVNLEMTILGKSEATAEQLRTLLKASNPSAPDLVDLFLNIGDEYGVRGDVAFCQAAKETGWWKYGGLVKPEQNNYCGLYATGRPITEEDSLNGADPDRVKLIVGEHGAYFDNPETGVEAQIQHLYAYATTALLPTGKTIVDPRFSLVKRGSAPRWIDLGGKWAYPGFDRSKYDDLTTAFAAGDTYGHSLLNHYYFKAVGINQ
jgi:hypothetical protein